MATIVVRAVEIYVLAGVVFAAPFLWRGVGRLDPAATEGGWGFRALLVPGVVAFWPLLARRWLAGAPPPEERNAHRDAASPRP